MLDDNGCSGACLTKCAKPGMLTFQKSELSKSATLGDVTYKEKHKCAIIKANCPFPCFETELIYPVFFLSIRIDWSNA